MPKLGLGINKKDSEVSTPQTTKPLSRKERALKRAEAHSDNQETVLPPMEEGVSQLLMIPAKNLTVDRNNARTRYVSVLNPTEINEQLTKEATDADIAELKDTIKQIMEFAEHLKHAPLQTPIVVYRKQSSTMISEGHLRYFSLIVAHGENVSVPCKLLEVKPRDLAQRRFRENARRHDLALKPKLMDFGSAMESISPEDSQPWNDLGLSSAAYYQYLFLYERPELSDLVDTGKIQKISSVVQLSKMEKQSKACISSFISEMKSNQITEADLSGYLDAWLKRQSDKPATVKKQGRKRTQITFKTKDTSIIKQLVSGGFAESFTDADWDDVESVQKILESIIEAHRDNKKQK